MKFSETVVIACESSHAIVFVNYLDRTWFVDEKTLTQGWIEMISTKLVSTK
jgi:hypothetical protein